MKNSKNLLSGRLLFQNIVWAGLSQVIPIIGAIIFIPILIEKLGDSKYGLLSIIWVVISLASILDLGLGRAVIKFVSEKISSEEKDEIGGIFGLSWILSGVISSALCVIIILFRSIVINSFFKIAPPLIADAEQSLIYTALAIPIVFSNSIFASILKAYQEFKIISIITGINTTLNYFIPIIVLLFTESFEIIVLTILLFKIVIFFIYLILLVKKVPWIFKFKTSTLRKQLVPVLRFGGWVSISDMITPILSYSDRFLVASFISMSAVTYYVTPLDIITKIGGFTVPIVSVLFPAISNAAYNNKEKVPTLLNTGFVVLTVFSFPLFLFFGLFSDEILTAWVSEDFSKESNIVLSLGSVAFLFKSFTYMPYSYLNGVNKPDIVTKVHLVELTFYLLILIVGLRYWGIIGAALAFLFRCFLDFILLSIYADKLLNKDHMFTGNFIINFVLIGCFIIVFLPIGIYLKTIVYFGLVFSFFWYMWKNKVTKELKFFLINCPVLK